MISFKEFFEQQSNSLECIKLMKFVQSLTHVHLNVCEVVDRNILDKNKCIINRQPTCRDMWPASSTLQSSNFSCLYGKY